MNFLVVGLGSMGKRRIRCLKALGYSESNIYGFDLREDRRDEVKEKYNVNTFDEFEEAVEGSNPSALIISVPPHVHHIYMKEAIRRKIHFFVEASVLSTDFEEMIEDLQNSDIVGAPSLTLHFHPAIETISKIVKEGQLGKISNFVHHSGQYLPDWHTYEDVADFYVSNPATGGAREIVPFELGWIVEVFGIPEQLGATVRKTIEIKGAEEIDDTYNILMDYSDHVGVLIVDVVSRKPVRRLLINGSKKQLRWDWDNDFIEVYDPSTGDNEKISYNPGKSEEGYHSNIGEQMYIDELDCFIKAIETDQPFVNSLTDDYTILKMLYRIEEASKSNSKLPFNS